VRRRPRIVHPEGQQRHVERKPTSDEPQKYPPRLSADWERDHRVKLPHDRLVRSTAITYAEFCRATRGAA
jgi:hypothetical protein